MVLALSGHARRVARYPPSGVKRTWLRGAAASAYDPSGRKPTRNPAVQLSYRTGVCYSFRSEAQEVLSSETLRFHSASRRGDQIRAEHERARIDEVHQLAYSTRRSGCGS